MNYWETPSYLALILIMCKRNVSPKEIISRSRKPEKSLILTKLQSYNYKQCWTKQTYRSTHYTDPEGMLRLSREVKETMKPTINKDTTNFAIVVAVNHTQVTKSAQPVVLNATIATNAVISARFAKKETYLRLLSYHMTPISSTLKSPAERLNNCKLWTTLPMPKHVSGNNSTSKTKEELYQQQKLPAFYYNKAAGLTLQPFQSAQPKNIYDHHTQRREQGTVIQPTKEPRSFIVKNNWTKGIYQHTRSQLKPQTWSKEQQHQRPTTTCCWDSSIARQHNYPPQDSQTYMKRSWRTSKPPNKLDV